MIRLCKLSLVLTTVVFYAIVVLNNLIDYGSNYAFVQHVLSMDTTFEGNALMHRAITASWVHHAFYWSIILWELAVVVICGFGSWKLVVALKGPAESFNRAKNWAVAGLTVALLQWYLAFITVGGEWFAMWQSQIWNGQSSAHRMFAIIGISLLFLVMKDED